MLQYRLVKVRTNYEDVMEYTNELLEDFRFGVQEVYATIENAIGIPIVSAEGFAEVNFSNLVSTIKNLPVFNTTETSDLTSATKDFVDFDYDYTEIEYPNITLARLTNPIAQKENLIYKFHHLKETMSLIVSDLTTNHFDLAVVKMSTGEFYYEVCVIPEVV